MYKNYKKVKQLFLTGEKVNIDLAMMLAQSVGLEELFKALFEPTFLFLCEFRNDFSGLIGKSCTKKIEACLSLSSLYLNGNNLDKFDVLLPNLEILHLKGNNLDN